MKNILWVLLILKIYKNICSVVDWKCLLFVPSMCENMLEMSGLIKKFNYVLCQRLTKNTFPLNFLRLGKKSLNYLFWGWLKVYSNPCWSFWVWKTTKADCFSAENHNSICWRRVDRWHQCLSVPCCHSPCFDTILRAESPQDQTYHRQFIIIIIAIFI